MSRAKMNDLPSTERAQKARDYLILLLYDLEERIEDAVKEGKITLDTSSEIIDLIAQIKQDILDGKKRSEILTKLNDLKAKWKNLGI
mgnify:CR=1 FL=1